ncbi:MAG: peptidylprolyl isomerase [Gemmatimonadaceae bacterium]
MNRSLIAVFAAGMTLAACEGFKEALTAHVDVAARAESQELSVERLAEMIGNTDFPLSTEFARQISGLWVDYQLLAHAAAHGDSLKDTTRLDRVLWPMISEARVNTFHEQMLAAGPKHDSSANEARYGQGELLAARHILFRARPDMTPAQKDSVRRRAEATRARLTGANFAQIAGQTNDDPTAKSRGGDLGIFPRGAMVKEFEEAVLGLQPGQISPLVETSFGYHIIRRTPYSEVRGEIGEAMQRRATQVADSTFVAKLEAGAEVELKENTAEVARAVVADLEGHRNDKTVLAETRIGDFTVEKFARWVRIFPQRQQVQQVISQAPDSLVRQFVKNMIRNELILHAADSAKVQMDPQQLAQLRSTFAQVVGQAWSQLGVAPAQLSDSARTEEERERVAATRVETYVDRLLANQAQFVPVPTEISELLRDTYEWRITNAGVERAVERGRRIRATRDSTRAAQRPQSQVPMGTPPQGQQQGAPSGQQQPQAPAAPQP